MVKEIDERFEEFFELMRQGIEDHKGIYGDTWESEPPGYLENRVKQKLAEFDLTGNPAKLISLANLTMLLYLKIEMRKKQNVQVKKSQQNSN